MFRRADLDYSIIVVYGKRKVTDEEWQYIGYRDYPRPIGSDEEWLEHLAGWWDALHWAVNDGKKVFIGTDHLKGTRKNFDYNAWAHAKGVTA